MKGIILAGGTGSRLFPITSGCSKQLVAVYDKPMIYYPLSVLMLAGISDVLIISNKEYIDNFKALFGDGSDFGISITYAVQNYPTGIPEAFLIGEHFIGSSDVALILGDNIIFGPRLTPKLKASATRKNSATIFAHQVKDPRSFGVVEIDDFSNAISIEEKPNKPKSNFAITGLYFFDSRVVSIAKSLVPSERGETEITDILKEYMKQGDLRVELLGRGYSWFDAGTVDNLYDAGSFVRNIQKNQGFYVSCLEEIAFRQGWISATQLLSCAKDCKTEYQKYIRGLLDEQS